MPKLPPIHPGEILYEEFLKPLGLTPCKLSKRTSIRRTRFERIVRGEMGITADTALVLSKLFNTTAQFQLNLQNDYDLQVAEKEMAKVLKHIEPFDTSATAQRRRENELRPATIKLAIASPAANKRRAVLAEAGERLKLWGNAAYAATRAEAREARECGDRKRDKFLSRIALEIAKRTDFEPGLDTATRMLEAQAPYEPEPAVVRPDGATLH